MSVSFQVTIVYKRAQTFAFNKRAQTFAFNICRTTLSRRQLSSKKELSKI